MARTYETIGNWVIFVSMGRGRPENSELEKLRNKLWARMLFVTVEKVHRERERSANARVSQYTYAWLERQLMGPSPHQPAGNERLQALAGVVNHGRDPRRVERRILKTDGASDDFKGHPEVNRRSRSKDDKGPHVYIRVPMDLVALGEKLSPGSSEWYYADIWQLLAVRSITPEHAVKQTESRLEALGLRRSSLEDYKVAELCGAEVDSFLSPLPQSIEELVERYKKPLRPLAKSGIPSHFALMISLLIEAGTTRNLILFDVHFELVTEAVETLCSHAATKDMGGKLVDAVIQCVSEIDASSLPPEQKMWIALPFKDSLKT